VTAPVILMALLFWCGVFTIYFASQGTTPLEFLFGRYEPLPRDLGKWSQREHETRTGWLREERLMLPGDDPSTRYLLHQVRHVDPVTREVMHVEPERRVRRRRAGAR
jgi:hypothetical protein